MASLITCPHCGTRPKEEFTIRGLVPERQPLLATPEEGEACFDSVYMRDNPRGRISEHWYHGAGCGRWLIVERDNVSHAVFSVTDARSAAAGGGAK